MVGSPHAAEAVCSQGEGRQLGFGYEEAISLPPPPPPPPTHTHSVRETRTTRHAVRTQIQRVARKGAAIYSAERGYYLEAGIELFRGEY